MLVVGCVDGRAAPAAMHETTSFDQADFSQGKKGLSWHGNEGVTKDGVDFCVVGNFILNEVAILFLQSESDSNEIRLLMTN